MTVTGTLRSDESANISTEIDGRVQGVHFTEGQTVEQGALLFTLDDTVYRAELATAEANLQLSERNNERAMELLQRNAGTVRARDEAEAQLAIDHAEVDLARARLDKTRITAPFAGVVGLREVSVGGYVTPGQDLVNLEDIDPIKVDFPVPERALSAVEVGQAIEVTVDAWPGRTFEGEVYAIDPQIDAQGRSIAIRATIDNQERLLRPGLFAAVRLITARRDAGAAGAGAGDLRPAGQTLRLQGGGGRRAADRGHARRAARRPGRDHLRARGGRRGGHCRADEAARRHRRVRVIEPDAPAQGDAGVS